MPMGWKGLPSHVTSVIGCHSGHVKGALPTGSPSLEQTGSCLSQLCLCTVSALSAQKPLPPIDTHVRHVGIKTHPFCRRT